MLRHEALFVFRCVRLHVLLNRCVVYYDLIEYSYSFHGKDISLNYAALYFGTV
jgi:hypothetical protein